MLAARVSESVLEIRRQKILEWESMKDLVSAKVEWCCQDEAEFNLEYDHKFWQISQGNSSKAIVPTAKGVSITIFGAISEAGLSISC